MCGIAGRLAAAPLTQDRCAAVLHRMRRRGPDGEGYFHATRSDGRSLELFHSRLSIIDLDARSDQPFRKGGLTLVYNGEIYNYVELRSELEALGHRFETTGDTEVLLEAWRAWGLEAIGRLVGMFSFAIHEANTGRLTLVRDRFGEKPLYLWDRGAEGFLFASEVKTLAALAKARPDVDSHQLRRYLVNGYKGLRRDGRTFFQDIRELPAAHAMVLDPGRAPALIRYWTLAYRPEDMSPEDAQERVDTALWTAVSRTLRADVPVAVRLSGGIDSNVVAGLAHHRMGADITCFSIIEDDWRYDESAMIAEALKALNVRNRQIRIPREGFLDRLDDMIGYFDGPPLTISYYLHYLVSEAIHQDGFKMALGGTGADEVFSGYYDHYLFWLSEMRDEGDFDDLVSGWRESYGRFVRNPHLQDPRAFIDRPTARDHIFLGAHRFSEFLAEPFDEPHAEIAFCDAPMRNRMMNELVRETVPVMLHDDDLAAMRWSVENRAPYLDKDLVETLFQVPSRHLIQNNLPKYLLRHAGKGVVPDTILDNPRKQGINAPVTSFVDFAAPNVRDRLMQDGVFFDIVKRDRFEAFLSSDIERNSDSKFLFSLLAARMFLDRHEAWTE
ncbi:asparagine synthase (glutamine-hydrolyzing) [Pacificispira sp.]|uniref:asparagine synthase (glutamine-hydrolyzing) n=1 Tax=Pacificispira sp. TaxID=2888761 RepID=UPI003B517737